MGEQRASTPLAKGGHRTCPRPALPGTPDGEEAHLGLMPGTFSALEAAALLFKVSLSTLLPLRDGAESEMV